MLRIIEGALVVVLHLDDVKDDLLDVVTLEIHAIERVGALVVVHGLTAQVVDAVLSDDRPTGDAVGDDAVALAVKTDDVQAIPAVEVVERILGEFHNSLELRADEDAAGAVVTYLHKDGVRALALDNVEPVALDADHVLDVLHDLHAVRAVEVLAHQRAVIVVTDEVVDVAVALVDREVLKDVVLDQVIGLGGVAAGLGGAQVIHAQVAVVVVRLPERVDDAAVGDLVDLAGLVEHARVLACDKVADHQAGRRGGIFGSLGRGGLLGVGIGDRVEERILKVVGDIDKLLDDHVGGGRSHVHKHDRVVVVAVGGLLGLLLREERGKAALLGDGQTLLDEEGRAVPCEVDRVVLAVQEIVFGRAALDHGLNAGRDVKDGDLGVCPVPLEVVKARAVVGDDLVDVLNGGLFCRQTVDDLVKLERDRGGNERVRDLQSRGLAFGILGGGLVDVGLAGEVEKLGVVVVVAVDPLDVVDAVRVTADRFKESESLVVVSGVLVKLGNRLGVDGGGVHTAGHELCTLLLVDGALGLDVGTHLVNALDGTHLGKRRLDLTEIALQGGHKGSGETEALGVLHVQGQLLDDGVALTDKGGGHAAIGIECRQCLGAVLGIVLLADLALEQGKPLELLGKRNAQRLEVEIPGLPLSTVLDLVGLHHLVDLLDEDLGAFIIVAPIVILEEVFEVDQSRFGAVKGKARGGNEATRNGSLGRGFLGAAGTAGRGHGGHTAVTAAAENGFARALVVKYTSTVRTKALDFGVLAHLLISFL